MEADFWHQRWQQNQIGFHQTEINPYLKTYWEDFSLKKGAQIFVPLCGKSSDLLWLVEQGYQVTGVELSEQAIKAFFQDNSLPCSQRTEGKFQLFSSDNISLYCGDFFDVDHNLIGHIDGVYDRAALVALPEGMRRRYAFHLQSLLNPGTLMLLVTMVYPQKQMDGPPFSVSEDEVQRLFSQAESLDKLKEEDLFLKEKRFSEMGVTEIKETIYRIVL
ncbi:MAG: thiopurine S-methyltransferase [Gammaproteobacteria bacterium]